MNKKSKAQIAIGYARTANETNSEESNSIENQEKQIKEYCRKNGLELTAIFIDPKMSDAQVNSIADSQMAVLVAHRAINHLVCVDRSRISRSASDYLFIKNLLRNSGVKLDTVSGINPSEKSLKSVVDEVMNKFNSLEPQPNNKVVKGK